MKEKNQPSSSHHHPLLLRAEMETELRTRAYKDDTFRQALQTDPRTVLERDYPQWFPNGKIPEGFSIRIIEEEEESLNVVLLPKRAGTPLSLMEDDLIGVQGVAGLSPIFGSELRVAEGVTGRCNTSWQCAPTIVCVTRMLNCRG